MTTRNNIRTAPSQYATDFRHAKLHVVVTRIRSNDAWEFVAATVGETHAGRIVSTFIGAGIEVACVPPTGEVAKYAFSQASK